MACLSVPVTENVDDLAGAVVKSLVARGKGTLQRMQVLENLGAGSKLLVEHVQEAVVVPPTVAFALRQESGIWKYVSVDTADDLAVKEMTAPEFLRLKDQVVDSELPSDDYLLELPQLPRSDGMTTLCLPSRNECKAAAKPVEDTKNAGPLLGFLKKHRYNEESLLVDDKAIADVDALQVALIQASDHLQSVDPETPHAEFDPVLRELGLDKGWGGTAETALRNIRLLLDILECPEPDAVNKFFSAVPVFFNVVILSPHDYLAPDDVMGYSHTAAQHLLNQVRAVEEELILRYKEQGLDDAVPSILIVIPPLPDAEGTGSGQVPAPVDETQYSIIIRSPLSTEKGGILGKWVSRFDVWPYLDIYTDETVKAVVEKFDGTRPDLSFNNYSDGTLVAATLLVHKLEVTQGTIADALCKSSSKQLEGTTFPCGFSSYSPPQPEHVYYTIGGPKQLDVAAYAPTARPSGVAVQAVLDSLPTHMAPSGSGWTTLSPPRWRIWRVGITAVLFLLGFAASSLALSVNGDQLGMFLLLAMTQVGLLIIFNALRNL